MRRPRRIPLHRARPGRCACPCWRTMRGRPDRVEAPTERPRPPIPREPTGWSRAAGYSTGFPPRVAVAHRRDEQCALGDGVVDRATLDRRGRRASEAEIDDPCAMIDGVDDRGCLVEVGERALPVGRLDHHQPGFARAARNPVAVRGRAGCERGDEGAVAVQVPHCGALRPHAVGPRRLRGEVRSCQIRAGVDHGDRDSGSGKRHRFRNLVGMRRGVLPLECRFGGAGEARLCSRAPWRTFARRA